MIIKKNDTYTSFFLQKKVREEIELVCFKQMNEIFLNI